ncbi:MAG: hypothetical protein KDA45_04305 [Planctomycetales bacterium]|nr:hypothetical protein [Planctomycetales bacterium]
MPQQQLILALLFLGYLTTTVTAHPFHISQTEMEFNAASQRIEVSLKLHAVDLEQALSRLAGRKVDVEQRDVVPLLSRYLQANFYIIDSRELPTPEAPAGQRTSPTSAPRRSQLHYVGHELEATWCWIYFELELPLGEQRDLSLVNTVLFNTTEHQLNIVSVRSAKQRFTLKMTDKQRWSPYRPEWCRGL